MNLSIRVAASDVNIRVTAAVETLQHEFVRRIGQAQEWLHNVYIIKASSPMIMGLRLGGTGSGSLHCD